jgi:hypothetical protein
LGERLVNRHRRFIFSWRRTGNSSCATTPLKAGIDAGRARGNIQSSCEVSIEAIDCQIARLLGRSPSTVSREINRNGGYDRYRAALADEKVRDRARRPKRCKLADNSRWRESSD